MSHWETDAALHHNLFETIEMDIEDTPFFTKPFIIPVLGLVIGGIMLGFKEVRDYGKLVLYFGAQSFMNVYMSWLMRKSVVVRAGTTFAGSGKTLTQDLTGIPAGFALTALQQVISFLIFILYFCCTYFTRFKYVPKPLNTSFDRFCVVVFGLVFCMNIALNNFSLSLISITVNLIIRSCLPLTTFLSQQVLAQCDLYPKKEGKFLEIFLMCVGVTCAGVFTWAKMQALQSENHSHAESNSATVFILGVLVCLASLLCGSLNLALAGVLGTSVHLNPMDTVAYMAVPATLFLLPVVFLLPKPVPGEWYMYFNTSTATDYEIMKGVWTLNHEQGTTTFIYGLLSGVFAFLYNVCQFTIVQTLSPSATAFGGNFNKAALIFLSLLTGLERQVSSPWNIIIWCAIIGNITAFGLYSHLQMKDKMKAHQELDDESEDESEEGSEDEESEFA